MAQFVLDVFIAMETAQIYERVKERVRERLRKTERHRWLGKEEVGGGTLNAVCLMSSYLFLVMLPVFSQPLILYRSLLK